MYLDGLKPAYWHYLQSELTPKAVVQITIHSPDIGDVVFNNFTETEEDFLLSFSHHRSGDLLSNSLPRNTIEFTVCNTSGMWDPNNRRGKGKWLTVYAEEKLIVDAEYGFYLPNGQPHLIPCGRFCLSDYGTSSDGLQIHFKASDPLEYMIGTKYSGESFISFDDLLLKIEDEAILPDGLSISGGDGCPTMPNDLTVGKDETLANIYQKLANASGNVIRHNRFGQVFMDKVSALHYDYKIPLAYSYTHPEIGKERVIGTCDVSYNGGSHSYTYPTGGNRWKETVSVSNDYLTKDTSLAIANNTVDMLSCRKISGEYRSDLLLDVYDRVTVETKYGDIKNVVLTDINITFAGSFRAKYEGYIFPDPEQEYYFLEGICLKEVENLGDTL